MLFSSTVFLFLFLPLVLALYALVPRSARNVTLLLASLLFYFWGEAFFLLVMLASIAGNHVFGLLVDRARTRVAAKRLVALAVVLNLGLLCGYKYLDWLFENLDALLVAFGAAPLGWEGSQRLPIGISFFTFQALSYVVDVYRGDARVQRNPLDLALYVSMFPQLIAGPIVRYHEIEAQLRERSASLERFGQGVRRFVIGLGKKVLIAAPLQVPVDLVFDGLAPEQLTTPLAWLGVLCYTFQLYFDFSGYSDMAVGLGHMFGFELPENFDYPFVARSVRGIWRRWHISLTTWFRDYLYIPLGGNRAGELRTLFNLVLVFVLVGLWHGASWSYVVFGLYHGLFLVAERRWWGRVLALAPRPVQHVYTMLVWVVGLAIFRSASLAQGGRHLLAMLGLHDAIDPAPLFDHLTNHVLFVLPIAAVGSLPTARLIRRSLDGARILPGGTGRAVTLVSVSVVFVLSALVMAATTHQPFIYFRF